MFDFVHKHRWIIQILLVLIAVPFAFFGVESYTRSMRGADEVANVDGIVITQREFGEELRRYQERLRAMFGPQYDIAELDTPASRDALLKSLIEQRLLAAAAIRANLVADDAALRELIAAEPAFQAEGRFSKEMYEAQLRAVGMDPASFESRQRREMATSQLTRGIVGSSIFPRSVAQRLAELEDEKREIAEVLLRPEPYAGKLAIDDAQIKAYYDANAQNYRAPERLRAEYVVLSAADLERAESVSDAELEEAYKARIAKHQSTEQRRASHILIQAAPDAKDAARKAARALAEDLRAQVSAAPGRFAELAKKHSQDPGSAAKGGDLGFYGRGMLAKPFEDAMFAMKEGEISQVVESDEGYHVIRLTAVKADKVPSLAELKGELRTGLLRQKALKAYAQQAADFGNTVYEQADSLAPAATKFKLAVKTTDWLSKTSTPDQLGVLANPKVLKALFADDATRNRRNIDAVEVSPGTMVAARVTDHRPATQLPLEGVKGDIERLLRRMEAAKLARSEGSARLEQLLKGSDADLKWSAPREVSRRDPKAMDADTLRRVMAADAARLPAYIGADRGADGYALYRVSRVLPAPEKSPTQVNADLLRGERLAGRAQYLAYVAGLRAEASVRVNRDLLDKKEQ